MTEVACTQNEGSAGAAPACPLCHGTMVSRNRDPFVRAGGLVLLYAAAFLLVLWLPSLHAGRAVAILIIGVSGWTIARQKVRSWCPACWFETEGELNA